MAESKSKSDVLEVKSSSMSPADLEAEIAAAASSIGGAKTVNSSVELEIEEQLPDRKLPAKKKPAPKKAPVKTAKKTTPKKASAKKPTKKTSKSMTDVRPGTPKKKTVTKAKVKSASTSTPSAVKVKIEPKSAVAKRGRAEKPKTLNHHAKDLKPIGDAKKLKAAAKPKVVKAPKAKPVAVTSKVKVKKKPISTPKPYKVVKAKSAGKIATKAATKAAPKKAAQPKPQPKPTKHTPHVARIFDTQTYHIPITVDHHHRKAAFPQWATFAIIMAGVGTLFALYFLDFVRI